jgi:hypothetical protein
MIDELNAPVEFTSNQEIGIINWFLDYLETLFQLQKLYSVVWDKQVGEFLKRADHGLFEDTVAVFSWKAWKTFSKTNW